MNVAPHTHTSRRWPILPVFVIQICSLICASATALSGQTFTITELFADSAGDIANTWETSSVENGGSATLVDLATIGGDVQANTPSGSSGALRFSTGFDNADIAYVTTYQNFGDAATVLESLNLSYSYYKESVTGGNIFAAPAVRLTISSPGGTGDNYGQLIYEPTWNQPGGGSKAAPADAWQTVSIDSTTGALADASGGWWWTGGFEVANSSGGPPLRSLEEWVTTFQASDAVDFATSSVSAITLGVGSFNQGQIGYVDSLSIAIPDGVNTTYNFSAVPEPSAYATMLGFLALGAVGSRRRYRLTSKIGDPNRTN